MADRIEKDELARRLAARMQTDTATASAWMDGIVETLYESFKAGESVTLRGFGSFYLYCTPQAGVLARQVKVTQRTTHATTNPPYQPLTYDLMLAEMTLLSSELPAMIRRATSPSG